MKPYNPLLHMICTPNTGHPVLGVHIMQHVALYGLYSFVRFWRSAGTVRFLFCCLRHIFLNYSADCVTIKVKGGGKDG